MITVGTLRARLGVLAAASVLALSGCGDVTEDDSSGAKAPDESSEAATQESGDSSSDIPQGSDLGDYDGLCSWATPEDMEKIFGTAVDAVGFDQCRFVAADDLDVESQGIYHVAVDQIRTMDETLGDLKAGTRDLGLTICEREDSALPSGGRIVRTVTCPTGSGEEDEFGPSVLVEVGPGRYVSNMPFRVASKDEAVAASHRFVEIMTAMAEGVRESPLLNEAAPGQWVELYNPTDAPIDLTGYRIRGYDARSMEETPPEEVEVAIEDGATIPPGGHLVVNTAALKSTLSWRTPTVGLWDAEGRWIDALELDWAERGEVVRREGDGGTVCSGSPTATKGKPNPPASAECD